MKTMIFNIIAVVVLGFVFDADAQNLDLQGVDQTFAIDKYIIVTNDNVENGCGHYKVFDTSNGVKMFESTASSNSPRITELGTAEKKYRIEWRCDENNQFTGKII